MGLRMAITLMATILLAGTVLRAQDESPARRCQWQDCKLLVGAWRGEMDGLTFEELWSAPDGGIMVGAGKAYKGDKAFFFEYLRVTREGEGATYAAQPMGRGATAFPMIESGPRHLVFENPEHDFPRRLHYELTGDGKTLSATLTGVEDGHDKKTVITMQRISDTDVAR